VTLVRRILDLPYRPEDMFDLVSDIRRYPDFVKWMKSLRVLSDTTHPSGFDAEAEAVIGFRGVSERFVTTVRARSPEQDPAAARVWRVEAQLVSGPFRRLRNTWVISPGEAGSRVEFLVDFEFRNLVLQALAASNLDLAVRKLVAAFSDEAARRYGSVAPDGASDPA
jgi:coenzyme Q-binding protein COQ10